MNIEQAKTIPISVILDKLNRAPQRTNGHRTLYFSVFRNERTPSLWVDNKANLWRDFGDAKWIGGDGIHLVRGYLDSENENSEVSDALRWLRNMTGFIPDIKPVSDPDEKPADKTLILRETKTIDKPYLYEYGRSRGIPDGVLKKHFKQATLFNTKTSKVFHVLCMKNGWQGHELRAENFKGCIGKKYITFIRGTLVKPAGVNVFEGMFDFASAITQNEGRLLKNDSIVLHSLSNLKKGTAYIKNYGYTYCYTWMDNDEAGKLATESWDQFCNNEPGLTHVPMNHLYAPYKDLNAALVARLEL